MKKLKKKSRKKCQRYKKHSPPKVEKIKKALLPMALLYI